jgi:zinc protease
MTLFPKRPTMAAVLLAGLLAQPVLAAAPPPASAPGWAQDRSDLKPDPAVRFGVLANGMRYAIMRNDTPGGETSLRLRVGSGSLEESDAEQGLAHVLEHMAFRGSRNVPPGEMIKILEREGLAFGPDTNAETEWTQTVYMLDIPHTDARTLDTGLMLMRETAGALLIDPKALAIERGVVLSEERLRDTPNYRAEKAQLDLFLHGQLAAERFPIGKINVIKTAPASLVRTFYDQNYRPERTTLVAVGDFDPAAVEAQIKTLFSTWRPVGPPTAEPDLGQVAQRGLTVRAVQVPGASTRAVIAWARPYDASPDTAAKERRETIENLGLAVLNRRLGRLAQGEHPPFLSASAAFENVFDSAKLAVVEATSASADWRTSLTAAEIQVRQLVADGVGAAELKREIEDYRATLQNAVAGAATRPTPTLADELVRTVDEDEVFTPPSEDLATFDQAVRGLTPEEVDAAIKRVFAGSGPLVELAGPDDVPESAVAQVFKAAEEAPLAARAAQAAVTWPYTDFGKPGAVVQRRVLADLGVTQVTFANGVRLTVKPTQLRKDQILVSVDVGAGRLALPKTRSVEEWSSGAFIAGGFGKLTVEDSAQALAGKLYGVNFGVTDEAFRFTGATRPQDLATQLQVITAYLTDPGYRPEAFERLRATYLNALPQLEATPGGVFHRDAGALLASGDARFAFPTREDLLAAKPGDVRALLEQPLTHGRIEITIVGDVTADEAIARTAETLGALAPRPRDATVEAGEAQPSFPAPTAEPVLRYDTGRPDQAVDVLAWPATGFFSDMKTSRAAILAGEVLGNRLLDKVRIAEGATYSPETTVDLSQTFPDYGYILNMVEMPPAVIPGFFQSVASIAADLAATPISADELARAKNPRLAGLRRAQLTNEYWLGDLDDSQADPRRIALIRTTFPDYEAVTPADIQAVVRRWFKPDKAWELVVRAKPSAAQTPAPPSVP